jgi:hypothetical protein
MTYTIYHYVVNAAGIHKAINNSPTHGWYERTDRPFGRDHSARNK